MHRLIILLSITLVNGGDLSHLGYKYGAVNSGSLGGLDGVLGGGASGGLVSSSGSYGGDYSGSSGLGGGLSGGYSSGGSLGGLSGGYSSGGSLGGLSGGYSSGGSIGGFSGGLSSGGSGYGGGLSGGSGSYGGVTYTNGPTEFNKEFYYFTAPEEHFEDQKTFNEIMTNMKKNLRVIFIKAPEHNAHNNAAVHLTKQITEDKTAIYVLTKQPDLNNLATELTSIQQTSASKPEVHFVKYRTHEDALNAQQSIQGQYEHLGGSTHTSNEGVAPVLDFASKGPVYAGHSVGSLGSSGIGSVQILGGNSFGGSSLGGGSSDYGSSLSSGGVSFGGSSTTEHSFSSTSGGLGFSSTTPSSKYLPIKKH